MRVCYINGWKAVFRGKHSKICVQKLAKKQIYFLRAVG
jgi:hypothetical protein